MTGEAWFRPKRYGWGATPANWKGWLFLAVMILLLQVMRYFLLQPPRQWAAFVVAIAVWLAVTIGVSIWKCDGEWHWRWGRSGSNGA
jgi:MFS superfamily sulfate permease-like transporter